MNVRNYQMDDNNFQSSLPGISVTAPIRRSTPWAFLRKNFPFVPTIEMSTLFAFLSTNQLNAQGAVTENPGMHHFNETETQWTY